MEWTQDIILRLRGLWTEGHSTAEIGRRLGVSKNAVVGKAHRLDLPARPSPIRRDGPACGGRRSTPRRVAGPTLPPLSSISAPATPRPAIAPALGARPGELAAPRSLAADPPRLLAAAPPRVLAAAPPPDAAAAPPHTLATAPPPVAAAGPPHNIAATRPYARQLTCCWPIGEPGTKTFRFCDDAANAGKPYCADHAALAYVRVRDRRDDAA